MAWIAGLPMYDLPGVAGWQAAWWRGLARHLRAAGLAAVPARLTRRLAPEDLWAHPRLLFAQACGYPLTHAFAGRLRLVATPRYGAPGCVGSDYASALVVGADAAAAALGDLLGGVCAINGVTSQSGCNALRAAVAAIGAGAPGQPPFRGVRITGSHLESIRAVARGEADVCAVDVVTLALLRRHRPARLAGTRVLGLSPRAPGLPYVSAAADADTLARLRAGLFAALADPDLAEVRAALLIEGADVLAAEAYGRIAAMAEAGRRACPSLGPEAAAAE